MNEDASRPSVQRSAIQWAARGVGAVFLVVGILGFVPGITDDAPGSFAGEDSGGSVFGVFQTSVLHNVVHVVFGILGVVLARTWEGSRNFLVGGGVAYLALSLLGIFGLLDWLPADDEDDWLHLGLGVAMVGLGALLRGRSAELRGTVARA